MESGLQWLTGSERRVVFVPKDKWPQIRQDFIRDHGLDKKRPANSTASSVGQSKTTQSVGTEPPLPDEPPVDEEEQASEVSVNQQVATAQKMFGSEIVKVEDN